MTKGRKNQRAESEIRERIQDLDLEIGLAKIIEEIVDQDQTVETGEEDSREDQDQGQIQGIEGEDVIREAVQETDKEVEKKDSIGMTEEDRAEKEMGRDHSLSYLVTYTRARL